MAGIRGLPLALAKKAAETINEDPDRIQKDLDYIKDWLKKQRHLNVRMEDQWLIAFLRGCKHSLERTKEKLDTYHTLRTLIPEYLQNRDPRRPAMCDLIKRTIVFPLENKDDPASQAIIYCKQSYDPEVTSILDLIKYTFLFLDIIMYENDQVNVRGFVVIVDLAGTTWRHMTAVTPSIVKKFVTVIQKGYPLRLQCIHLINVPSGFQPIINLITACSSPKLKLRFMSHQSCESLYEFVPQEIFHKEFGGNAGTSEELDSKWRKKLESYYNWIEEDVKYCSYEDMRIGKPKNSEALFGIEGSFRQLCCD